MYMAAGGMLMYKAYQAMAGASADSATAIGEGATDAGLTSEAGTKLTAEQVAQNKAAEVAAYKAGTAYTPTFR